MADFEELKNLIADTVGERIDALAVCVDIEAYAKVWPHVFMVRDWGVWNESKTALRLQAVRWLENTGAAYDFWQFRNGWGLVGFKDPKTAAHFKLRWAGQGHTTSAAPASWTPQPVNSTFEAPEADTPGADGLSRGDERHRRARPRGIRSPRAGYASRF